MTKKIVEDWNFPTSVRFGPGRIAELADACKATGMKKPLLITDEGLKDLPIVRDAIAANEAAGLPTGLFAGVKGNPTGKNVDDGLAVYRAGGYDGVIAFGGGSGLDAAKAVALMAGQTRQMWDFECLGDWWTRADPAGIAPIVAVPTTSGTGSEVGRASVITKEDTHEKKIIFHPKMLPVIVISDPELTVGLPPHVTAAVGFDAFVHCFEAHCAPGYHPMAEGVALEGMRLIADALPRAYDDGKDIEARADMLAAASMGATAFQKGLGGVHALANTIGGIFDSHHGLTNAVLLPYVMRANRRAIEGNCETICRLLNLAAPSFETLFEWVLAFRTRIGIVNTLTEIAVDVNRAEEVAIKAKADPSDEGNPIDLSVAEYAEIFRRACAGDLG